MTVLFFRVEGVLNFPESEARAPSGRLGIVDRLVKDLKNNLQEQPLGTQLVLYGNWTKDWDFETSRCTADGIYLIKKLDRKGLHIMDKAEGEDPVHNYVINHHVDDFHVLT